MELKVFRLQPQGAFHFGIDAIGLEASAITFASDRLYAALYVANLESQIFPEWHNQQPNPPFRISSCFPYVGDVQLFPRPLIRPMTQLEPQRGERKPLKKIRFVSSTIFKELLDGKNLRDFVPFHDTAGSGVLLAHGAVLVTQAEAARLPLLDSGEKLHDIWSTERRSHVTVGRATTQAGYYEVVQVWFNQHCGLGVLATGDTQRLEQLLCLLGENGIGGRRSKGLGLFELKEGPKLDLPTNDTDHVVVVSSYLPTARELETVFQADQSGTLQPSYSFEDVSGWLNSFDPTAAAQRRRLLRMIAAGSVIRSPGTAELGREIDIRPSYAHGDGFPHNVWRHGQALAIGIPYGRSRK